ncbi:MAG TPA: F0F1 ATP synthase subunit gamma [Acidiphilium sp.]|nr:MAG: F0F1 ATP synthase subunit gamma [Acidiphilium sp. 21-60-14]OYV91593.1 MAG: F0F1 ATP synthase subunit gamma [Acidiphilium sp. 37-60-79]OZB40700.1 MAG: F0F1 ATP synthase subunit gamma [Acidiphilium sp. 34-60-192]HQT87642.1 F0F1 ATP synthase subunit gamma [Acidiphilium sp.]HQU24736.1 F0F1 ATP synthase subunit gamma [Acidiphilium sp.]
MPSLKSLRNRISSVKSTQKITKAMKMVAAAKLRRAQAQAEAARPYAARMAEMMAALAAGAADNPDAPALLVGTGRDRTHLLVVMTADRGLAGAFNTQVARAARLRALALEAEGKSVKIFAVGRKGRDFLKRDLADRLIGDVNFVGRKSIEFADAEAIAQRLVEEFEQGGFDICTLFYNHFVSVIAQRPTMMPLIPTHQPDVANDNRRAEAGRQAEPVEDYEIEPDDGGVLDALLPRNLAVQIYRALLDSAAGEHGARMTAMDNASRNAGDMINRLTLNYNRTRQANITRELIEIISGAEAL